MFLDSILAIIDHQSRPSQEAAESGTWLGRRALCSGAAAIITTAEWSCTGHTSAAAVLASPPATLPGLTPADGEPADSSVKRAEWAMFRTRFVQPDGRVVDTGNHGVSHTESQGLGMLFAVAADDQATFELIWTWTHQHLSRGSDALHAWRYDPNSSYPVSDHNNASDGDIYIAGALARASGKWQSLSYLTASQAIARDILGLLVHTAGGRTLLLPAAEGFVKDGFVVINPSYYIFPLMADLAAVFPSSKWSALVGDGRKLVAEARFGGWRLPPDWLRVSSRDGSLSLHTEQEPRFSFDAVRVPLFMAWDGGRADELAQFVTFWGDKPAQAPAWANLQTDECAPYRVCCGVLAIAAVVRQVAAQGPGAILPTPTSDENYYSAALVLLSRIALAEIAAHGRPDHHA